MVGRLATALLDRMGVETTTFFFELQIPSMIVLIVGIIGLEVTGKSNKWKKEGSVMPFPKELAKPAVRALHVAGFDTIDALHGQRYEDIAKLHGVGEKALQTITTELARRGLALEGMKSNA